MTNDALTKAADLVRHVDGLVVTAGAGMGVDSGLPDFRGEGGFWKHYPLASNECDVSLPTGRVTALRAIDTLLAD